MGRNDFCFNRRYTPKGNEGSNPDPTNPDPSNPDPTNPEHPTTDLVPGYPVKDGTNLTSVLPKTPVDDFKAILVNNKTGYKVVGYEMSESTAKSQFEKMECFK